MDLDQFIISCMLGSLSVSCSAVLRPELVQDPLLLPFVFIFIWRAHRSQVRLKCSFCNFSHSIQFCYHSINKSYFSSVAVNLMELDFHFIVPSQCAVGLSYTPCSNFFLNHSMIDLILGFYFSCPTARFKIKNSFVSLEIIHQSPCLFQNIKQTTISTSIL